MTPTQPNLNSNPILTLTSIASIWNDIKYDMITATNPDLYPTEMKVKNFIDPDFPGISLLDSSINTEIWILTEADSPQCCSLRTMNVF